MNLLDIFGKCDGIRRLTYEDFKPLNWSYNDYFRYMSFCDEIRSSIIVSDYLGKIDGIKVTNRRDLQSSLVNQRMKALFDWLEQFSDETLPEPKGAYIWLITEKTYDVKSALLPRDEDIPNPGLLYQASFHFTLHIERFIAKTLKHEELFHFNFGSLEKLSVKELEEGIDYLKSRISRLEEKEPVFPDDIDLYYKLMIWAKDQVAYNSLSEMEELLYDYEEELSSRKRNPPEFNSRENILYIYFGRNIICKKEKHELLDVNCVIQTPKAPVTVNAQYCCNCDKFIISRESYQAYLDRYKYLPAMFMYVEDDGNFPSNAYGVERAENSPLSLAGYTVKAGVLSETERHCLLLYLIKNGALEKYQVLNYLEMFIRINGRRMNMSRAVSKWESDAEFIRQYNMENQETYVMDDVRRYGW